MNCKFATVAIVLVLLQGCATPYAQFYNDNVEGIDVTKHPNFVLSTGEPKVIRGNIAEQDSLKMLEDGYKGVGYSSFNAGNVDEKGAITQAKKVYASVVILYSKYTGSVSGVLPLTLPDTKTSTTSMSGTAYGSGGNVSYSGTANTTTYGTSTTYIPYTEHRSDYVATYWVKLKPPMFGTHLKDLMPEMKQQIGSNKGMLIHAVVKGSPAFEADILKGDILRRIGDVSVFDQESFQRALSENEGKETDVTFLRANKEITKSVKLRAEN